MKKGKKVQKKRGPLYKILASILFIASLFLIGSILYLNILNHSLLFLIIGIISLLNIGIDFILLKGNRKVGIILSIIFILIFGLLDFYLGKTTNLLSELNLNYKTYNYSVVVLKDSSYKKLKDINDKVIGYFDDNSDESKKSLDKILSKIEIETTSYEDTHEMANALLDKEVDALLIENSYLDILSESITFEDETFQDKIRKIYQFVIVTQTSDISKDINVTKTPFNVYISGIDTYGEISSVSRSDVNMVATVNPETRQILLTSIPRDYYVQLHGKSGYRDKLTHAGLYGTDMSIQTIEDLLDIEINYYVKVNFSSVIDIVNAIDGVTVYSDYTFTSIDGYHYQEGYNEVNGEEALSFARERKSFATGDRQRIKNQQALLKGIFDKCTSKAIITKYSKLLDSISGSFVTNMKMSRSTSLIKYQLTNNYDWNLVTNSLNGSDSSNYTYSAPSTKAYVMEPIVDSVEYASDLINQVLDGKILDKEEVAEGASNANKVTKENTTTINSSTEEDTKKEEQNETEEIEEKGLEIKLGRSSVEFYEGEEYVYYGYTATYNEKEIKDTSNIQEEFKINGKVYDNYQDLVFYISNKLKSGEYQVTYTIKYKDESVSALQTVTIKKSLYEDATETDSENSKEDTNITKPEIDLEEEQEETKTEE